MGTGRRRRSWALAAMLAVAAGRADAADLRILTWDAYIAPELLTRFEAETGIHPVVVTASGYP